MREPAPGNPREGPTLIRFKDPVPSLDERICEIPAGLAQTRFSAWRVQNWVRLAGVTVRATAPVRAPGYAAARRPAAARPRLPARPNAMSAGDCSEISGPAPTGASHAPAPVRSRGGLAEAGVARATCSRGATPVFPARRGRRRTHADRRWLATKHDPGRQAESCQTSDENAEQVERTDRRQRRRQMHAPELGGTELLTRATSKAEVPSEPLVCAGHRKAVHARSPPS